MNFQERSWVEHCKYRFPREFGIPWRFNEKVCDYVWNQADLLRYVNKYNEKENCYISVYSFKDPRNYDTALFDTIYIDLDDEEHPEKAIDEGFKLVTALHDKDIYPRIYFSGKKGTSIYLDFVPFDIAPENIKGVVSLFEGTIEKRLGLKTMCHSTWDAQSRISRLPNTKHMGSGLYCIPLTLVDLEEGLDHIRELASQPRDIEITVNTDNELPYILKDYEKAGIKQRERGEIIKRAQELKTNLGLGSQRNHTGKITKCQGVLHAESGQVHPGREPTADGLILAYSNWYNMGKDEIKAVMRDWAAYKCNPPREWNLIEARIEKFYGDKRYTPCTFLMKYGHCKGADCAVMQRKGG